MNSPLSPRRVALRYAKVPRSDDASEIVRGIWRNFNSWFDSPEAQEEWVSDTREGGRYIPMPFEDWREMQKGGRLLKVLNSESVIQVEIGNNANPAGEFLFDFIPSYLEKRGWFLKTTRKSLHTTRLNFESRRGVRVEEVPPRLFHVSTVDTMKSILKKGLLPRSPNPEEGLIESQVIRRSYPDRIYLAESYQAAVEIGSLLREHHLLKHNDIESVYGGFADYDESPSIIYVVDTSKLREGTKFYKDPDYPKGFYTLTQIPPAALKVTPKSAREAAEWFAMIESQA